MERRSRRALGMVAIGCVVGVGFAIAAPIVLGGTPDIKPRLPSEPGYNLASVTLVGEPYTDPKTGDSTIDVRFVADWTETAYPGRAECRINVLDEGGSLIGSKAFEFGSYIPSADSTLPVTVAGIPQSATVACTRAVTPPADANYVISDATISLGGNTDDPVREPRLSFRADWTTDIAPLLQECKATITLESGATEVFEFEVSVGDGETAEVILPPEFQSGTPEVVSCAEA